MVLGKDSSRQWRVLSSPRERRTQAWLVESWTARECMLCKTLARNVALEEEVKELRGLWSESKTGMFHR